jgi:protein gp37
MSTNSSIEWTATVNADGTTTPGATWNPVVGCKMVSPGCAHCYAETMSKRLAAMAKADFNAGRNPGRKQHYRDVMTHEGKWNGAVRFVPEVLNDPLAWKKPRRVFVNSMSDLFHEGMPFPYIDQIWDVMRRCPQHTFQILTKRPERMAEYFADVMRTARAEFGDGITYEPLPNVWLGTSVEDQARADERIPHLLKCPAAIRFLSCEPLLGPVNIAAFLENDVRFAIEGPAGGVPDRSEYVVTAPRGRWVIEGGESGPSARACDVGWIRSLVKQCKAASVPSFVKQLGAKPRANYYDRACREVVEDRGDDWPDPIGWNIDIEGQPRTDAVVQFPMKDRKGGDIAEFPEDLRVRQMPGGVA